MKLYGEISRADLEDAIREAGGTVVWDENAKTPLVGLTVEVDPDYAAYEASAFTEDLRVQFDLADVRDFVSTIARGDRAMALALAPRLFIFDSERDAVARALQ
ncbi:hypothetical protein [Sphingomonas sp.]|uniref:hypothetical protein n=1 Tax=Sphingomonas sp. TaxID=28214 RepID=UPI003F6EAE0E